MPEVGISQIEGLRAWMQIAIENGDSWYAKEGSGFLLDIYGEDEHAYLVLDVYEGENDLTQFAFLAAEEAEDKRALIMLFDLLRTVDYSLAKLLAWLQTAKFFEKDEGMCLEAHGLRIWRSQIYLKQRIARGRTV